MNCQGCIFTGTEDCRLICGDRSSSLFMNVTRESANTARFSTVTKRPIVTMYLSCRKAEPITQQILKPCAIVAIKTAIHSQRQFLNALNPCGKGEEWFGVVWQGGVRLAKVGSGPVWSGQVRYGEVRYGEWGTIPTLFIFCLILILINPYR